MAKLPPWMKNAETFPMPDGRVGLRVSIAYWDLRVWFYLCRELTVRPRYLKPFVLAHLLLQWVVLRDLRIGLTDDSER